jgi:hypothetical protein
MVIEAGEMSKAGRAGAAVARLASIPDVSRTGTPRRASLLNRTLVNFRVPTIRVTMGFGSAG